MLPWDEGISAIQIRGINVSILQGIKVRASSMGRYNKKYEEPIKMMNVKCYGDSRKFVRISVEFQDFSSRVSADFQKT